MVRSEQESGRKGGGTGHGDAHFKGGLVVGRERRRV
jgi:hypothetical protein